MRQPLLAFTSDPAKVSTELSPKLRRATAMMLVTRILTSGAKGELTASAAVATMRARLRGKTGNEFRDVEEPKMLRIAELIAERFPNMPLAASVLLMLQGMSEKDEHDEILAGTLAWATLGREDAVSTEDLFHRLMPEGPPTVEYLDELVEFYRENPDLLWPPEIVVETRQ